MIQIQGKATVRLPPDAELARHDDGKLKLPVAPDGRPRFILGPVYTKRQCQRSDYSAVKLAVLLSLKTMELLKNRLQP